MLKRISKYIWVKGLQGKLKHYEARNVMQRQEIRRLKQLLREGGNYTTLSGLFHNLINYLKRLWKR